MTTDIPLGSACACRMCECETKKSRKVLGKPYIYTFSAAIFEEGSIPMPVRALIIATG
jgi:hypothetical protein